MKQFHKATKTQSFLRLALVGPSGSGKTFSSLRIAEGLCAHDPRDPQRRWIALVDSERGSASKYAGDFSFDTLELDTSFSPREYIEAIDAAVAGGYDVLIIDSLSHAWNDKGGILEMKDAAAAQSKSENDFTAWRLVTPEHNKLVDAILRAPLHVVVTLRAKTDYVVDKDDTGRTRIRKVGLRPVQREGLEYEFDVVGDLDQTNTLTITKTRCRALNQQVLHEPGEELGRALKAWLDDGAAPTLTNAEVKALWELAQTRGLSVGGLLDVANRVLGTDLASPRDITRPDLPRVVEAVKAHPAADAAS